MAPPRKPAILVVEDEPAFQNIARAALEKSGFSVLLCGFAREALPSLRAGRPDLVLLDVGLPDGNGFDVCRALRAEAGDALPIIFLTARADVKNRVKGFEAGAQDYVQKPFAPAELVARVRVHLKSTLERDALKRRNMELELRERVRQDLTDMIVHDLKAPAASIQGSIELIRSEGMIDAEQHQKLLEMSEFASEMLLLMLNDMLDVSRSEANQLRPKLERVEVPAVVRKVGSLFEPVCRRYGVGYTSGVSAGRTDLSTDQQLLFRILGNLVNNGIKFSGKGGEVQLACEERPECWRFAVSDTGPGVPDEDKGRIFDKFVTLGEKRADRACGTGIGLAFCRVATESLRGKIWVENREGGGSRFLLELPCA